MYFDVDDDGVDHEFLHVVSRELFAFSSNFEGAYGIRSVPTHTEDGIPIRKIYVTNLPPETTRTELFGVFAQYGFIKSCWLRMGDKGPNRTPTPTYAFVTFSNPADAHKALQAPYHEKTLRGRSLRISPADSWHQPAEDADGRVQWRPNGQRGEEIPPPVPAVEQVEQQDIENPAPVVDTNAEVKNDEINIPIVDDVEEVVEDNNIMEGYGILDVLNPDCLSHIMSYIPLRDLIRSERVSKRWQMVVQEYIVGIRVYKTSWWQHIPVTLTTAVLRRVLQRVGGSLVRLHIDHNWSALNDRTAHIVGKFCPNLEELKVVGMHTKNWNPLVYGCKNLKRLIFVSCNKLTDSSLVQIVKSDSPIEHLTVANNTHVTGLFLNGSNIRKLNTLSFYNCCSLQGAVITAAIDSMPNLTTLKLDVCPVTMLKIVPLILKKLPRLEELSLSEYTSGDVYVKPYDNDSFCEALDNLKELKILNLTRNVYMTNSVLKQVARSCLKLTALYVSSCNSQKHIHHISGYPVKGVGDEGLSAVLKSCKRLRHIDVSYLALLSDTGLALAASLPALTTLIARGNPALSAQPFSQCLAQCHLLEELFYLLCIFFIPRGRSRELETRPRSIMLRLASTPAAQVGELPTHRLLAVNVDEDRSNPHLRPDFVDRIFDDSSDDSFDDLYEPEDLDDFLGDDPYMDNYDLEDYANMVDMGIHVPNLLLL
ncbi:F-box/LRR-repeat protein 4 [Papilio machaon]|uniref:F-box/LRR-repeat protein 4 n=1 Tax=Papilio machaon TaxID=76193 RepID=A0A194RPY0_PAPMA|nr:F-box/LRR-repeat protein 4 [Papilio machaon]